MDHSLYDISLIIALTLMLFFAGYFIAGKTPDKPIYDNYRRSRRFIATALLVLSANYFVHLFAGLRFENPELAILMNISTYFISYWLFSTAFITLLKRSYLTSGLIVRHLSSWLLLNVMGIAVFYVLPAGLLRHLGILALAAFLLAYGLYLSHRIIKTYHQAVRIFDDTHSENIAVYIRWMSIFTWCAVVYGVSCGVFTFLPDEFVFLWILSSVPFYIYLYCSYMNYLLFYEQVEVIIETSTPETETPEGPLTPSDAGRRADDAPAYFSTIDKALPDWLAHEEFTFLGITIEDAAMKLGTNRTYLSSYIKQTFGKSFREWIGDLRVEHAKRLMAGNPRMSVKEVCEAVGFLSQSYFVRIFIEREGMSPTRWKKASSKASE